MITFIDKLYLKQNEPVRVKQIYHLTFRSHTGITPPKIRMIYKDLTAYCQYSPLGYTDTQFSHLMAYGDGG